ncbi:hypothetical protein LTR12_005804 [Friedmanniomyces endolithicus]|nr:hypothetical protein LTR74_013494 [Friedmanniomyces endolithicus]KAK1819778.1 hypothetical protein LTR12_005804 [Friedmanniomyces endolithicus]
MATMDAFQWYSVASSAYFALQAVPLLLSPKLVISLLAEPRRLMQGEAYIYRSFALLLLAFAALNLLLTGIIPLDGRSDGTSQKNPYAFPTLTITTAYHMCTAFYIYTQLSSGWSFAFGTGLICSGVLFCFGIWNVVFGSQEKLLSKMGADKRTSGFPFANSESAKEIKREAKEKDKSKRRSVPRMTSSRA